MSTVTSAIGSEDYTVVVDKQDKFISIYVRPVFSSKMDGAYVYTIKGYTSLLANGENFDLVKSVSYQLNKKYDTPIYLNVNGFPSQFALVKTLVEAVGSV